MDLSFNSIAFLPESVGRLTQLLTLRLSHNKLGSPGWYEAATVRGPRSVCVLCIQTCTLVCVCVCIYLFVCGEYFLRTWPWVVDMYCMYGCMYVYTYVCMDVFMHACMYVCMYVYICVYMYVIYIYIYICICIYLYTYILCDKYIHIFTHTSTFWELDIFTYI
jgi:hypothetical protein